MGWFERLFGGPAEDNPPHLPTRYANVLIDTKDDPDGLRAVIRWWVVAERRYIEWVENHPSPKPEWLKTARSLRAMHDREMPRE